MNEYRQLTANEAVLDYLYRLMDARPEYLKAAFDEMLLTAGSVKAYLSDVLQLTDDRLTDLRNRYLID
ncbi:hypothetical protein SDC9_202971 [bioreactor metagenome]|uniref:Uncharacterized protein n=1 Tax=bioreactor metagenome TaxID=1076179 RepID=A0A645IXY2_9ZZZZ